MVILKFERTFTTGYLEGVRNKDKISFVDIPSAEKWIRGVNDNNKKGYIDYSVRPISYSVK